MQKVNLLPVFCHGLNAPEYNDVMLQLLYEYGKFCAVDMVFIIIG